MKERQTDRQTDRQRLRVATSGRVIRVFGLDSENVEEGPHATRVAPEKGLRSLAAHPYLFLW